MLTPEKPALEFTLYAKRNKTKDGRAFTTYVTRLPKKDGSEISCGVRFRSPAEPPSADKCPINLIVERWNANLNTKTFTNTETGETRERHTLWVSAWVEGLEYEDHSLDDFI